MACEGILTEDILFDCDNPTTPGIEVNIMLINQSDIDDTLTTVDPTDKLLITNLALKAAKTAIILIPNDVFNRSTKTMTIYLILLK